VYYILWTYTHTHTHIYVIHFSNPLTYSIHYTAYSTAVARVYATSLQIQLCLCLYFMIYQFPLYNATICIHIHCTGNLTSHTRQNHEFVYTYIVCNNCVREALGIRIILFYVMCICIYIYIYTYTSIYGDTKRYFLSSFAKINNGGQNKYEDNLRHRTMTWS